MSKGFTDWTDLGIFPLQDVEKDVPIGMRMTMVGGRVAKRPDAGANGGAAVTEYAREDGLGTLGDIHPWLFWQTADREKRAMGSWSMAWGTVVTDSASPRYGGTGSVQPLTKDGSRMVSDARYRRLQPAWESCLPVQPEGMMAIVMPSTSETEPDSVMFSADRRLVAAGAGGPGEAGTTIVDMQPDGVLCMGGSFTPGMGGRHARLQGLLRVIALEKNSAPALGGSMLNGIAINYGASQQDDILGYGMIYGSALTGGHGPTTGSTHTVSGGPPPPNGGYASGGGGKSISNFGAFSPQEHGNRAVGFMAGDASGPIVIGCQKHRLGVDRDGHNMTSAHISYNGYFYKNPSHDGPMMFEGDFPDDVKESAIPTYVHLAYDSKESHSFVGGSRGGMWRWYTTVPYVNPFRPPTPPTAGTPHGPPTPGRPTTPGTPAAPGGGAPGTPAAPGGGGPSTPGGGGGSPSAPGTPGTPGAPSGPPGPITFPRKGLPYAPGHVPNPANPRGRAITYPRKGLPYAPPTPLPPPPPPPKRAVTHPEGSEPNAPATPIYLGEGDVTISEQVGDSSRGRDVGMYGIFHPFNNGFSALTFRPQLWIKGVPNFERNPELGAAAYIEEEKVRPSALTVRAWGAQNNSGGWDYLESPADSRARGGIVNGGILISPAEFEMEDYLGINSQEDTDSPTATTYVTFAPKVAAAFGKPTTVGVLSIGAKTIHQDTATGKLVVSEATDSLGATTDIIKLSLDADGFGYAEMQGTGAIKIPSGTTAERPSVAVTSQIRVNTTNTALEYYAGAAWNSLTPGGGGTVDVVSNVATASILGRVTAGSGDSEELTATQVRTLINVANGADVSPVASVNAQTGVVVLDADDIANGAGSFFMTVAHKTMADAIDVIADQRMVGNISGLGGAPSAMTPAQVQTMNGFPVVSSGAGTPSSTPATIGDEYWDSTNNLWYKAKGTASAADWKLVDSCMASGFFTFNGTSNPTLENAKNLTLIRNGATGTYQAAIPAGLPNTDAAGKDYAVSITYYDATGSGAGLRFIHPTTKTATVFNFLIRDNIGALTDAADTVEIHVHAIDL